MTSDELVGCLFEPIADYVEAHFRELSDDQLNKFRPLEIRNHGIELSWFGETIRRAVPDLVRYIRTVGPDLVLRDGTEIELKAASDCWPQYMAGTEKLRGWRRKYLNHPDHPSFAGCLFLGDGSNESKIEEIRRISKPAVELRAHRLFQDAAGNRWVLGLLLRADWPGEHSASRPMLVMQPHPPNAMQTDKGANKMLHIKHPVIDAELLDLYKTVNPESETKEILESFLVSLLDVFAKARKTLSLRRHKIGYTVDGPNGKMFMWINVRKKYITCQYKTLGIAVEDLHVQNLVTGSDGIGSEFFKVRNRAEIQAATGYALKVWALHNR